MRFEFATATRILFGPGVLKEGAAGLSDFGRRAMVVTGAGTHRSRPLLETLANIGVSVVPWSQPGEPTVSRVVDGARQAREEHIDFVIGFGGGSVIDAAKAIAALAANEREPLHYLEVVGRGQPFDRPPLPFIAIPTTAGAGAEVTRNAVLTSTEHRVKASLRSPRMLARLAIVDPELTVDLPKSLTASTGLDALTQLIEPFVSCRANPLTDGFCREGLPRAARSLRRAWSTPGDLAARTDMAMASLLSGLALANAGLGAVHGFAAPIGGMFPAPHGAVCAALLPHVMAANVRALRERPSATNAGVLDRYAEIARALTGRAGASADDGVAWVRQLCTDLEIPPLRVHGLGRAHVPDLCAKAAAASSMKGNPLPLVTAELEDILTAAL